MEKPSFLHKPMRSVQEVLSGAAAPKPKVATTRVSRPKIANIDSLIKGSGDGTQGPGRANSALAAKLGIKVSRPPPDQLEENKPKSVNPRFDVKSYINTQETIRIGSSDKRLIKKRPDFSTEVPIEKTNRIKIPKKMVFDFMGCANAKYPPVAATLHKVIDYKKRAEILKKTKESGILTDQSHKVSLFVAHPGGYSFASMESSLTQTHDDKIIVESSTQTSDTCLVVSIGTDCTQSKDVFEEVKSSAKIKSRNVLFDRAKEKEHQILACEKKRAEEKQLPIITIKEPKEEEDQRFKKFMSSVINLLEPEMEKYRIKCEFEEIEKVVDLKVNDSVTSLPTSRGNFTEDDDKSSGAKDLVITYHALDTEGEYVVCANLAKEVKEQMLVITKSHKTLLTVWNTNNLNKAAYYLQTWGTVTALRIHMPVSLVISGSLHGVLNIWSLREDPSNHICCEEMILRIPAIHTGCLEGLNHRGKITAIEIIPETTYSVQLITMDSSNSIICWSLLETVGPDMVSPWAEHNTAWSNLKLRQRQVIDLNQVLGSPDLMSSLCLRAWEGQNVNLLYGTNCGYIGRCMIGEGENINDFSDKFVGDMIDDANIRVHDIDVNPAFNLFLAAFDDNFCRLYDLAKQRSILSLECDQFPIKVKWSKIRLSTFYVAMKNKIGIYDLIYSDMFPVKSYPADDLIDFNVVLCNGEEKVVGLTANGTKLFFGDIKYELQPLTTALVQRLRLYLSIIH